LSVQFARRIQFERAVVGELHEAAPELQVADVLAEEALSTFK
jgi:hypothetical protein